MRHSRMKSLVLRFLFLSLVAFCVVAICHAQSDVVLGGTIEDQSGAVIPNVQVKITNTDTGITRQTATNQTGYFTVPGLPPGNYSVHLEHVGFAAVEVSGLVLHTADRKQIDVKLHVGSANQTVSVNGGSLTTDNPAVSLTVSREFVENMPLNGRSFQDLIQLAPGAVDTNTLAGTSGYYTINGQRSDSNNYTVDGVSMNSGGYLNSSSYGSLGAGLSGSSPSQTALDTTQSLASLDDLQEFTIQTSGYSAEYGRSPGGQVQFTTRSGTNDVHGSLFDYFRNTVLDANSWYDGYHDIAKQAEHQNDFGGTVGGPIIVPRLYDGKNKTFYFFSYEGLRLLLPSYLEPTYVPTQAFRNWASPNMQPFLNAVPLPSPGAPGNNDGCTITDPTTGQPAACDAEFYDSYSSPDSLDNISARGDQQLGSRFKAFVRYAYTPSASDTGSYDVETRSTNVATWTAGLTGQLSSALLNDLRFGYSSDEENAITSLVPLGGSVPFDRALLAPPAYDTPYAYLAMDTVIAGTSLRAEPLDEGEGTTLHQYNLVDSIAWTRGVHSIKVGVDWRRVASTFENEPYEGAGEVTKLTDIQRGYVTAVFVRASVTTTPVFANVSLYAQDHWRISPRLSIDYGLRWDLNPPPGPSSGHYPATLTSADLSTAQVAPAGTPPYRTDYLGFAPRFGFSWNAIPSQRHSLTVRGAFGIFFDTGQQTIGEAYTSSYPFQVSKPNQSEVQLPLSTAVLAPPSLDVTLTPPYPGLTGMTSPALTLPYTEQWNVSLDEALNPKNALTISYIGNNGRKLLFNGYYSKVPGNPAFSSYLDFESNGGQSSYNALQVQDVGRVAEGLDLVASFTYAHALDNISEDFGTFQPIYGNSDSDLRRVLNVALNYQAPGLGRGGWTQALTHGWVLANRFAAESGLPLPIEQGVYYLADGAEAEIVPNLVSGVPIYLHGSAAGSAPGGWRLNPAAFGKVALVNGTPVSQGTLGRNYVRAPAFWAFDTALQRSFPIYDRLHLNFRVDAFNILNHPNLNFIDSYMPDSTFGEATQTGTIGSTGSLYAMGAARSLQLSLRLQF